MIINQAQNYGLSDLHQLRGRVGRSNKKAFCYLLTPPLDTVNSDARRRLKAIEDFSGLGSGFNIAIRTSISAGPGISWERNSRDLLLKSVTKPISVY